MFPSEFLEVIKALGIKKISPKTAERVSHLITLPLVDAGMGHVLSSNAEKSINALNRHFKLKAPNKFRIIIDHSREYQKFAITCKDPDPREMEEMEKNGYWDNYGDYVEYTPAEKRKMKR